MMKIGPKSQAQEPVERNMLVVYNSQSDKILAQYPKFSGMSVSDVGRRTYKQSRDYYSG